MTCWRERNGYKFFLEMHINCTILWERRPRLLRSRTWEPREFGSNIEPRTTMFCFPYFLFLLQMSCFISYKWFIRWSNSAFFSSMLHFLFLMMQKQERIIHFRSIYAMASVSFHVSGNGIDLLSTGPLH